MVALVLMTAFVLVERRSSAPLVRLAIFQHRPLTGANLAIAANAGGFGAMMFIATLYLQQVLGDSALGTGVAFVLLSRLPDHNGYRAIRPCAMRTAEGVLPIRSWSGASGEATVRRASGTRIGWPARHPPCPRISRVSPVEDRRL
jgi:hypothetical protein